MCMLIMHMYLVLVYVHVALSLSVCLTHTLLTHAHTHTHTCTTDPEDMMDISPSSIPNKKLHLAGGYASPLNHSPCVSPLMSLHHSFIPATMSRKSSSTQSESTPLSSPSSLVQSNPFAYNYDSGNCEHWQSGHSGSASGSTCSSAGQSPPGITLNEEHKMIMDSGSIEVSSEAPTPLSPKGLQFRQMPFNLLCNNLPSPIPRTLPNGSCVVGAQGPHVHVVKTTGMGGFNSHNTGTGAVGAAVAMRGGSGRGVLKPHPLHHDKHLSPFNSDLSHQHPHSARNIKVARSRLLSREIVKSDPLRPSSANTSSSTDYHSGTRLNSRLNSCSSPLAKLSMSSNLEDGSILGSHGNSGNVSNSGSSGIPIHQLQARERYLTKRRTSETSTDSQDESYMESDNDNQSLVGSLEEPVGVHMCNSGEKPPFDTKVLRTHS